MELAFVIFLVAIALLSVVGGRDSRIDDVERRRHYQG